ncbi:MAG: TonB-dependent receptor [Bacteroidales bacterium]|nr:TonB-dependent receptor [Bacteroidales bacterium]
MNNKTLLVRAILLTMAVCSALTFNPSASSAAPAPLPAGAVITGIVLDRTGETITGATVSTVGTGGRKLAVTDLGGKFEIDVQPGTELQIDYVGYNSVRVIAGDDMEVTLTPDSTDPDLVEVVAYGSQKKVAVTGAISSVRGDELTRTPVSSINNVLAGYLPGVTSIQYSGEPGADAAAIFIRGKGTWENASPLVLVDGVEREMWDIDPNEIESVTALKDASATAVYGMRGANGVLLVTTRRGREGKARVNVSASFSALTPTSRITPASSYEYATFYNSMCANDGRDPVFNDLVLDKFRTGSDPVRFPSVNWADYILKDAALQQQHNVNVSGGNNRVRYFVSAGMFTQDGLFREWGESYRYGYQYRRFNYRANVDINATRTTIVSVSVAGKIDDRNTPRTDLGSADMINAIYCATPFCSPGFIDGRFVMNSTDPTDNLSGDTRNQLPFVGSSPMAYYADQPGGYRYNDNRISIDLALTQRLDFITKGLDIRLKGAYNTLYQLTGTATAQIATYFPVLQPDGQTIVFRKSGEKADPTYTTSQTSVGRDWYAEISVNYNRTFNGHTVGALVLYNQSKTYYPAAYAGINRAYAGLAGRVTYDYRNRYLAEFNIGYNGSGNYARGHRFGTFPAGSLGWVISGEPFFEPLKDAVSLLKLRASCGLTGYDAAGYLYFAGSGVGDGTIPMGGVETNPSASWEKAFEQNYGADVNFLDDRLRIAFDYYREQRRDILVPDLSAPAIAGGTPVYASLGRANRWGWEVSVNWDDRVGKDFRYWIGANVSRNRNEIVGEGTRIGSHRLYQFWKYYYDGCEADYQKEFGSTFPTQLVGTLKPGDCVFVDIDKNGVIDESDKVSGLGHTDYPEFFGGLNLGLQYKGLSFSAQLTGAWNVSRLIGGVFRKPFTNTAFGNPAEGGLLSYHLGSTWTTDNPSQSAEYPRATWDNAEQNYADCTLYEKDAKYLRVKALQLSYDFDFPFMRKIGLSQLQLALSAYNPFTFTSYKWGDPEALAGGSPSYPLPRTFTASLKVGF